MNKERILGVVRSILLFIGGITVAKGWLDEGAATELVGYIMGTVGVVLSVTAPEKRNPPETQPTE